MLAATTSSSDAIAIAILIVAVIIIGAIALSRRNRSKVLQDRFGPEYQRAVRESGGSRSEAERELARRQDRVKRMHIEELPPGAKSRYTDEWRTVQTRFVDEPKVALVNADRLISNVMRDRGYPMENFDQSAADLSPDHSRRGAKLPRRPRHHATERNGRHIHRRPPASDGSLSFPFRRPRQIAHERHPMNERLNERQNDEQEGAFLPDNRMNDLRDRWSDIQAEFVDDPRRAVQDAQNLNRDLVDELTETFRRERDGLEGQWSSGGSADTEALRVALQRYRSFFNRLLAQ